MCYPGDKRACECVGTGAGYQPCNTAGDGYAACECSASTSTSSGAGGQGGADALLPFMAECTDSSQCATGLCFAYSSKGSHCTVNCADDTQCPSPSPGCNNAGFCKAP